MWTAPAYQRRWDDLRRRDLLFWFFVLSYVPGMLLIIVLVNDFYLFVPEHLGTYFSVTWLAGFAGASFYRQSFRCPRERGRSHRASGPPCNQTSRAGQRALSTHPFLTEERVLVDRPLAVLNRASGTGNTRRTRLDGR